MKRREIERLFIRLYSRSIDLMDFDSKQIMFESRDSLFSVFISDNIIV